MIEHVDRHRFVEQAEAERRDIAEPESESGQKADIGHAHGADAAAGIDPVANDRRYQRNRSDPVRDRIAGKARKCRNTVGNVFASHGMQRKPVIQRDAAV